MTDPTATIRYGEHEIELPIITGTEGEQAIATAKLRDKTELNTHS